MPGDIGYDPNVPHGIIAAVSDQSTGGINWPASVAICNAYTDGTYFDWRMPTSIELNYLHINRVAIGNFANKAYWSSSTAGSNAWYQAFSNGFQNNISQRFTFLYARAVRTF
jgi:hypothetical protein